MPDLLSIIERSLKAVRYGFFCVNDQIALALDGLCHAPAMDYTDLTEASDPDYEPVRPGPGYTVQSDSPSAPAPYRNGGQTKQYGPRPRISTTPPVSAAVPPAVAEGPSGGDLAPPLSPGATNPTGHPTSGRISTHYGAFIPTTVTRVVLVHADGHTEKWAEGWRIDVQDDGRTLKLFPRNETAPRYQHTPGFFKLPEK